VAVDAAVGGAVGSMVGTAVGAGVDASGSVTGAGDAEAMSGALGERRKKYHAATEVRRTHARPIAMRGTGDRPDEAGRACRRRGGVVGGRSVCDGSGRGLSTGLAPNLWDAEGLSSASRAARSSRVGRIAGAGGGPTSGTAGSLGGGSGGGGV
jgi:hypothetical protein